MNLKIKNTPFLGRSNQCFLSGFKLALIFTVFGILSCGKKDACLDSGGCWGSVDNVCRKNELNAQQLCDRSKISK
jgi:hypothetical protein